MTDEPPPHPARNEAPGCHPIGLGIGFFVLGWMLLCLITSAHWLQP